MTTEETQDVKQGALVSGLIGSMLGLVVMFFPPHFITAFFAPWVGGIVAGMKAHAKPGEAFVIGPTIGTMLAVIASLGIGLMLFSSSRSDGGSITQYVDNPAVVVLGIAGLWVYATFCGAFGAMIGGWLKRIG